MSNTSLLKHGGEAQEGHSQGSPDRREGDDEKRSSMTVGVGIKGPTRHWDPRPVRVPKAKHPPSLD